MQPVVQQINYEQAVIALMRSLSNERKAEVYDFVRFIKAQSTSLTPEPLSISGELLDEDGALMLASINALRPYWDTQEEDEAWAHLQKGTSS